MPGSTPNRGYPYPVNSDALNVAVDIESLARAIDLDFSNIAAPEALSIRPWTADAAWGSLAHPSMLGTEAILISRPVQPTIVTSWANQPVQIRYSAADAAHQLQVGLDHRFTGGHVYQMTGGSSFLVPSNTDSVFGDHAGTCFYRPRDAANHTRFSNTTGGHIYHDAWAHHFRYLDGSADTLVVSPSAAQVGVQGILDVTGLSHFHDNVDINLPGATTWNEQQLVIQAASGNAGLSFAVHQASWAVIMRANPGSTFAPCVDVMTSDTTGYARIAALSFEVVSSLRFKDDVQALADADLLDRIAQVEGATWMPKPSLGLDGEPIMTRESRVMGVIAEELALSFPEIVRLDEDGEPLMLDSSQTASTALAAVGALARKLTALEARLDGAI